MKLFIDRFIALQAVRLTATGEYGDRRRYYEIGQTLIVCRNGLDLAGLAGRVVDAIVGRDQARPGFTLDETRIGQQRLKITIFRILSGQHDKKLSEILRRPPND